jgi:hypothetical protein
MVTESIFEDQVPARSVVGSSSSWCENLEGTPSLSNRQLDAFSASLNYIRNTRHYLWDAARNLACLKRMSLRLLQTPNSSAILRMTARYHDYVRVATPGAQLFHFSQQTLF